MACSSWSIGTPAIARARSACGPRPTPSRRLMTSSCAACTPEDKRTSQRASTGALATGRCGAGGVRMHPAAPRGVEQTMKWMVVSSLLAVLVLGVLGGSPRGAQEVVVYTSEDQVFSEPILKAFEAHTGITV